MIDVEQQRLREEEQIAKGWQRTPDLSPTYALALIFWVLVVIAGELAYIAYRLS